MKSSMCRPDPILIQSNTTMTVRLNDALLLSAVPEGAKRGSMILLIEGPSSSTNMVTLSEQAVPYVFEEAGTYIINGFFSKSRGVHVDESAPANIYGFRNGTPSNGVFNNGNTQTSSCSLIVNVIDDRFANDPYIKVGGYREWACPNLSTNLVVEQDASIAVIEQNPLDDGGTGFLLHMGSEKEQVMLARLGENGPVVDRAVVHPFDYDTGGYWKVVTTFPDGSDLAMFRITLSEVPEDLVIKMAVITSGTTFDDGSLFKTLTAEDFDETGTVIYYMIRSPGLPSACHTVQIKQLDELITQY